MAQKEKKLLEILNLILEEIGENVSSFEQLSDDNLLLKLFNKM